MFAGRKQNTLIYIIQAVMSGPLLWTGTHVRSSGVEAGTIVHAGIPETFIHICGTVGVCPALLTLTQVRAVNVLTGAPIPTRLHRDTLVHIYFTVPSGPTNGALTGVAPLDVDTGAPMETWREAAHTLIHICFTSFTCPLRRACTPE